MMPFLTPENIVQARIECLKVAIQLHKLPSSSAEDVVKSATVLYNFLASDDVKSSPGRKTKDKSASVDPMS